MFCRSSLIALASLSIYLGGPMAARADEAVPIPPPAPILGGDIVEPCGFPTAVSMAGSCTGTLVHPQLVVYAAHCGDDVPWIRFGDRIEDAPGFEVIPEMCQTHPIGQFGFGSDAAFCRLAEPVEGIPIAPPLMGCEADVALQIGEPVTVAGYGTSDDEEEPYGIKRYLDTQITALSWDEVFIGGEDEGVCYGDSGGPTYARASDGSWRSFGITSWGQPGCGFGGYLSTIVHNIEWIETASGIDITPCHDGLGAWDPSPECTGFDLRLHAEGGDWEAGCDFGEVTSFSETCGEPFDPDFVDDVPPVLTIITPESYSRIELAQGSRTASVPILIEADDAGGWGVGEVELVIERDGAEQARLPDIAAPFGFENLTFGEGVWTLRVEGSDRAGNVGESEPTIIGIGVDPPPAPEPEPGDDTTDGGVDDTGSPPQGTIGGSETGDSEDETGGAGIVEDSGGCGCQSGDEGGGAGWLVFGVLALVRRRRFALGVGLLAASACGDDLPNASVAADSGTTAEGIESSTGTPSMSSTTTADADSSESSEGEPVVGCGNGIVEDDERCDDGNEVDGDGCSAACEPSGELLAELDWPQDGRFATANDVAIARDESIVVAGAVGLEDGGTAALVLGLGADLSVTWSTEIPGASPADFVTATALSIAPDGSIWLAGVSQRDEAGQSIDEPWIGRLGADGGLQWSQVVAGAAPGDRYRDVVAIAGGDAVAVGSGMVPDGTFRRLVRRHEAGDGAEVWAHLDPEEDPESVGLSGALSARGDVVVGGWVRGALEYRDLQLERFEDDGALADTTLFGEPLTSYYPRDLAMDSSGEAVACGSVVRASANNAMIGRFTLASTTPSVWLQRIEAMAQGATSCESIAIDALGRVALAGYAFNMESSFDPVVGRLDVDGEVLWSNRVVPSEGFFADFAEGVALAVNGDLIVVGRAQNDDGAQLWVGRVRG